MSDDFLAVMRQTLAAVRAGQPAKGTRLIQRALSETPVPLAVSGQEAAPSPLGTRRRARPLSDVIADLGRRPPMPSPAQRPTAPVPDLPDGAVFERRRHQSMHGARNYLMFRPSTEQGPIRGVVMMLHGCTQTPEDFAAGTAMNRHAAAKGLVVVYPEQPRGENMQLCWNWFRPSDQRREGGETALLADLAARVMAEQAPGAGNLLVAGLSAGGAMAALLANTHPDLVTAAAIHSGLAAGSAQDVVTAFAAMRGEAADRAEALTVPAIIFHGSADATVAPVNAGRLAGPLTSPERRGRTGPSRRYDVLAGRNAAGHLVEVWRIDGAGHAWSGGNAEGSYTDPSGPDASAEMLRFFLQVVEDGAR